MEIGGGKDEARRACVEMLRTRFRIEAALVSAPQLAEAMGWSKSSVHAWIKQGTFPIPHRRVGRSPFFTVDDVAAWYLSGGQAPKPEAPETKRVREAVARGLEGLDDYELTAARLERRRRDREVDSWKAAALAKAEARKR